ncbi:MAG: uroporphyrinogen-III C-methyltransferase [Cyanobacteria bacterium J06639_1]
MGLVGEFGKVWLVGAGLGDRLDLTVRALQLLRSADAIVTDALVPESLLLEAKPECEIIRAGKRGGQTSTPQSDIDRLLVQLSHAGRTVVRLKSGDPTIFGRVMEEVRALQAAGCPFEIVPGMSSAIAAAASAGIFLTDKHLSQCFAVISAHQLNTLPWEALGQLDTLVLLMGTRSLQEICDRLMRAGKSESTAIALIREAGRASQQVWTGSLETFADEMERLALRLSPAVIVVGEVVGARLELEKGDRQPLAGKTVLVTRANPQAGALTRLLEAKGAIVADMPTIEIVPPSSFRDLDAAIARLSEFDWLILTSANGVEAFFGRLQALGLDSRALSGTRVAVVGQKTAAAIAQFGIRPDFIPSEFIADAVAAELPLEKLDMRVLFPRVESGGREILVKALTERGAAVTEVAAYQSKCPDRVEPRALSLLQAKRVDIITFASSKTVRHFYRLLREAQFEFSALDGVQIAAIGPKTADTCTELLGRTDICAEEYTLEGLVEAIAAANAEPTAIG